ncbi:L-type lectin-domain containing receptor kinase IX.1 [Trifolium repens]|nr:L-type lectin-domain containing receptor kinase IX.1 [Trifolium repens]
MAIFTYSSHYNQTKNTFSMLIIIFTLFYALFNPAYSISFNFSTFPSNLYQINFQGDAFSSNNVLQLTKNQLDGPITSSVGRASFDQPVKLYDKKTKELTDFATHFSFKMKSVNSSQSGDGLSFFIAPFQSDIPINSSGGYLGLFSEDSALNTSKNQIVAVEFDSFSNDWDPQLDHVGINVNSIRSVQNVSWTSNIMKNGSIANAWISYNSTTKNLTVFLTYSQNPTFQGNSSLSHVIDLSEILPEYVRIGFSAATGQWIEIHNILSWSFNSSLENGFLWFIFWRKRKGLLYRGKMDNNRDIDGSIDEAEFERGTGPKKFTYKVLSNATNGFDEKGKLGEGGFGGVYKGIIGKTNKKMEVAVKRVSKGSRQGWCHEKNELLLVYEFMPNGSLDFHLFGKGIMLSWNLRYKIALGLASSLLYLHEEWEQCVVHRDIKSSNVMLDANFNSKLGDFGLARLVDHELGSQTTVLAGTMGYLAPECVTTGKSSKESDVYSFGVVALEIVCGRRSIEPKEEAKKVRLVEWVWELYGKSELFEGVDKGLNLEYDKKQMEYLMIIGLWCCHPDFTMRPSIRQVINVLNFEANLPNLPSKLPVPMYFAPPMEMCRFSYTFDGITNTTKGSSTYSSLSAGSRKSLL